MTRVIGRNPDRYMPLDEWLEAPRTRILRRLRWFDWVSVDDLFVALNVDREVDRAAYDRYLQMLFHLYRHGVVSRRGIAGQNFQYRLERRESCEPPPCWAGAA